MWKGRLRKVYGDVEELRAYDSVYGVCARIGCSSPAAAWKDNPMIRGSVDPKDFGRVWPKKRRRS